MVRRLILSLNIETVGLDFYQFGNGSLSLSESVKEDFCLFDLPVQTLSNQGLVDLIKCNFLFSSFNMSFYRVGTTEFREIGLRVPFCARYPFLFPLIGPSLRDLDPESSYLSY